MSPKDCMIQEEHCCQKLSMSLKICIRSTLEYLLVVADGCRQVVIVVDTNILVSAKIHLLMRLMDDWSHASDGEISLHVTALVPYIVLKELDGLKAGRRHSDPDAHSGMDSINALLLFF